MSIARVQGTLSVSRALGDVGFKQLKERLFPGVAFAGDLVTATPETRLVRLPAGPCFVILACDGLWDVLSNDKAAELAALELRRGGPDGPRAAAQALVEKAVSRGTLDNVTVMVVEVNLA